MPRPTKEPEPPAEAPADTHPHTCQSCGIVWQCDANNPYTGHEDNDCRYWNYVLCPECEPWLDGNRKRSRDGRLS